MSKGIASGVPPAGGFAGGGCATAWLPRSSARVNAEATDTNPRIKSLPIIDAVETHPPPHRRLDDGNNILETASRGFNRNPQAAYAAI
jgi:hypothetical protein